MAVQEGEIHDALAEKHKENALLEKIKIVLDCCTLKQRELDILFGQLYEDRTLGTLPEAIFLKMSKKYTDEQAGLDNKLIQLQKVVDSDQSHEMNVDNFLKMVRTYTAVNELTPEILRHFIDKIVVHHRQESKAGKTQDVEFYFNFIGHVDISALDELAQ